MALGRQNMGPSLTIITVGFGETLIALSGKIQEGNACSDSTKYFEARHHFR